MDDDFDKTTASQRADIEPDFDLLDRTVAPQHRQEFESDIDLDRTMASYGQRDTEDGFEPGDLIINRYKVLGELGQGSMGVVYKCFDETAGIEVALKSLPTELSHNTLEMEDVKENFQLIHNLHHPNIASTNTLERNQEDGTYYLIMEYCYGENLREWLRRKRSEDGFTWEEVMAIIMQVAAALDYAHSQKIVHRDVKPGNIMISSEGKIKVLDFGLAAQIHTSMTRNSVVYHNTSGTGPYMAPEQWRGHTQGAAADQYALAVMTYEMLTGELPFIGNDLAELQQIILTKEADPIVGLSEDAQNALNRAMSKNPADRFRTCSDFVAAFDGVKFTETEVPTVEQSGKRNLFKWLAVAAVILACVGYGLFVAFKMYSEAAVEAEELSAAELEKRIQEEVARRTGTFVAGIEKERLQQEKEIEKQIAEELRSAEEKLAEEKRIAAEKLADAQAKLAEEQRKAQEKLAEEQRKAQEKLAEERHLIEERLAEERRLKQEKLAEEQRIAAEKQVAEKKQQEELDKLSALAAEQNLQFKLMNGKMEITGSAENVTKVEIPHGITHIGDKAFDGCAGLTGITIPNSVTSIGYRAFDGCSKLEQITIPDNVTSIGNRAFDNCANLKYIIAPKHLSFRAPENCKVYHSEAEAAKMESVRAAAAAQKLQLSRDCTTVTGVADKSVTEVVIPEGVTSIGDRAFRGCSKLREITIPNSVTSIGDGAFSGYTSRLLDSVTSIGEGAFSGCTSLTSITIPDSVTSIGDWAFSGCTSLSDIVIPDSVTSIGYRAFSGCINLTNIKIGNGVMSIGESAFSGCSKLKSITIPDSVTRIGDGAFSDCTKLDDIEMGNSVEYIGSRAFSGCINLKSIVLPPSVKNVEHDAFVNCPKLKRLTVPKHFKKKDVERLILPRGYHYIRR